MKTQSKDAVALAMDWLAQLRDEDGTEREPADGTPAIAGAPPAGDFRDVPLAAPPAADREDAAPVPPTAADGEAAPLVPLPAGDGEAAPLVPLPAGDGEAAPLVPLPAGDWEAAPLVPLPAADWEDAPPVPLPAGDWEAAPLVPLPAADWEDAPPVPPPAADWEAAPPAAPPTADWEDVPPAAPTAPDSWPAAAPPPGSSGPVAAAPPVTTSRGRTRVKADIEITERAAIGDELRIPLAWCEMGSCISHHADPAALGEADIRARAVAAGWRADALGRLACPRCQQGDSWFWTAHPVALWDRDTAVAMTTLMAAAARVVTGGDGGARLETGMSPGGEPGAIPGGGPHAVPGAVPSPRLEMAHPPGRGRHRGHPAHVDRAR